MKSLLMVCQGNICRSPMAEGFFSHELKKRNIPITVSSAGLNAVVDFPPETYASTVMSHHGIDISKHRARQITATIIQQSDLILVMTLNQRNALIQNFFQAKGKTYLLGHWRGFEINDPLQLSSAVFENVFQQITLAWQDWESRILECAAV